MEEDNIQNVELKKDIYSSFAAARVFKDFVATLFD